MSALAFLRGRTLAFRFPLKARSLLAFDWAIKKPSTRVILSDLFGYRRIKVSLSKTGA